jgi:hypothetical protein
MSHSADDFTSVSVDSQYSHSTTPRMRRSRRLPGWSVTFALIILLLAQWLGNGSFSAATAFAASKPTVSKDEGRSFSSGLAVWKS